MTAPPIATTEAPGPAGSTSPVSDSPTGRPGPWAILVLSAWCGLVAGLLEVATLVVRKSWFDANRFYGMSRHFTWLIPMADLGLFLMLGVVLAVVVRYRPRGGSGMAAALLAAMTPLPSLLVAFPRIFGPAWLLLTLGVASRLVPMLGRHAAGFRRMVRLSLPVAVGLVAILAASPFAADRAREAIERSRPAPTPGAPNILLVVLDAVAAGHLDLHGYGRPTSPTLDELAREGIRFDAARAASPWTLPSHATMFTGRWPHELSAGWVTPLDRTHPTVAEYLGARGYATAGFVANTHYCADDSGLSRGFTVYRDYIFPGLAAMRPAALVRRAVDGLAAFERVLRDRWGLGLLGPLVQPLWLGVNLDRKDAATVHREFLDWLARRGADDRPFFAFLNDYDAHWPYQVPELGIHRFGTSPRDPEESDLIQDWWKRDKREVTPAQVAFARDAYDDCVAHLDEQLGRLIDELGRRGLRERTWVIVVADHGESFGEHAGVFCHGTSLYRTELHVPLLVVPPTTAGAPAGLRVAEPVSLRDLAATIVDLAGMGAGSPFPGGSLSRFWDVAATGRRAPSEGSRALSEVVPNDQLDLDRVLEPRPPLAALDDGDWTYIRREGEVREELYHLADDPMEARDRSADPEARPRLERMRAALGRLTEGPLTPGRFNP